MNTLKDGLIIVHASEELIKRHETQKGFENIRERIQERVAFYLSHHKPVIYTPFLKTEQEIPSYISGTLKRRSHQIVLIKVALDTPTLQLVPMQSLSCYQELKSLKSSLFEIWWLYQNSCVRATKLGIEKLARQENYDLNWYINKWICNLYEKNKD